MFQTPTPTPSPSDFLSTTTVSILVTVISSLISGIIGVIISVIYYQRYENRKLKLDTLRRFAANRFDIASDESLRVLNEIFVTFQDSEEVKQALSDCHRNLGKPEMNEYLLKLFKAMCKDLKIGLDRFDDTFFLKPFDKPRQGAI